MRLPTSSAAVLTAVALLTSGGVARAQPDQGRCADASACESPVEPAEPVSPLSLGGISPDGAPTGPDRTGWPAVLLVAALAVAGTAAGGAASTARRIRAAEGR